MLALDARNARDEARAARDEAKEHEEHALAAAKDSASAAGRTATALEEANALALSQIPTDPWTIVKHSEEKYEVRNATSDVLFAVYISEFGEGNDITPFDDGVDVGPGESLFFNYSRTLDSPAQTTLVVSWGDPATDKPSSWRKTLS